MEGGFSKSGILRISSSSCFFDTLSIYHVCLYYNTEVGRAMLLGSGYSAIPLFRLLANKHEVFVLGGRESDPLSFGGNYLNIDYGDTDAVEESARKLKIDYLIPSCNDVAYRTGTKVATQLGFPGFDSQDDCNSIMNKLAFRRRFESDKFTPRFMEITKAHSSYEKMSDVVLVKPFWGHSGIGIERVDLRLSRNYERISGLSETHFIEEYLEGTLHSHSAFFSNGSIVAEFIVDEYCGKFPFAVSESNHPSSLAGETQDKIREISSVIASVLKIKTGLLHSQFIFDGEKVWILESMRRCPGDFFGTLIEKATGYNYYENYLANFTNEKLQDFKGSKVSRVVVRQSIFSTRTGELSSINAFFNNFEVEEVAFLPFTTLNTAVSNTLSEKVGLVFFSMPIKCLDKNIGQATRSFAESEEKLDDRQ